MTITERVDRFLFHHVRWAWRIWHSLTCRMCESLRSQRIEGLAEAWEVWRRSNRLPRSSSARIIPNFDGTITVEIDPRAD